MAIDQAGLNSLLATFMPKNNMAALREQRANLLQKLQQKIDTGSKGGERPQAAGIKEQLRELVAVDQQIAQKLYDEISHKLAEQRLAREAAIAKKERDRERALAKHERFLVNRSWSKLLSAACKTSQPGQFGVGAVSGGSQEDKTYTSEVDNDLQESVQYGIAAAEVAVRRKNAEIKAQIEENAEKKQAAQKKKSKRVNIMA